MRQWLFPDAASGQGPDTLASKLSWCKEGMARVFAVMVQILIECWCDRGTRSLSSRGIYPCAEI